MLNPEPQTLTPSALLKPNVPQKRSTVEVLNVFSMKVLVITWLLGYVVLQIFRFGS